MVVQSRPSAAQAVQRHARDGADQGQALGIKSRQAPRGD